MHLKGRKNKSRWTRKMGIRQMLRAQETQRTAIRELDVRVQSLSSQRETSDADTLQSMTGGQQKEKWNQKWKTARISHGDTNHKPQHQRSKEGNVNMTYINTYVRAVIESAYLLWYWEVCLRDNVGDYKSTPRLI
ncbi:uncharacterized protein LOC134233697 isoform X2 [Saccostrea cucullata]|uniref:uncharacterized protein LOC134233697 isoform X2 n=1 Tax=Saccostrea cuccullata TaxID=36930 RepID=UPI002ED6366E